MIGERDNSTKYVLLLILATLFTATSGVWIRLSAIGPVGTAMWRALLGIPILAAMGSAKGVKGAPLKDILIMLLAGAFLGGEIIFFNIGMVITNVANLHLLGNLTALVIVPVSYFVFKEEIPKLFFLGAGITIAGVVILVLGKNNPSPADYIGDIFGLIVAVLYGTYVLITYRMRDKYPSNSILYVATYSMFAVLAVATWFIEGIEIPRTWDAIYPVLAYTFCLQVVGLNLVGHCSGHLRVNLASVITLMQPCFAGLYVFFLFGETLSIIEIIGMAIVILGVYITKREYQK